MTTADNSAVSSTSLSPLRWLRRWLARPLRLTVGSARLRFDTLQDFEFAIASRTAVPAMRVGELLMRTELQLIEEIDNLANLRARFGEILLDRRMQRETCANALERVGVQVFSKDHDWRTIFMGLLAAPQPLERHLELALATYQNYLVSVPKQAFSAWIPEKSCGREHARCVARAISTPRCDPRSGCEPGGCRLQQLTPIAARSTPSSAKASG